MPRIMSFPETAAHWDGPALFLAGAESDYVRPEHRPTIKALFPGARFAKLPGAGHCMVRTLVPDVPEQGKEPVK